MKLNLSFKELFSHSQEKENINRTRIYTPRKKEDMPKHSPIPFTAGHKRTRSYLSPKAADIQQITNRLKT